MSKKIDWFSGILFDYSDKNIPWRINRLGYGNIIFGSAAIWFVFSAPRIPGWPPKEIPLVILHWATYVFLLWGIFSFFLGAGILLRKDWARKLLIFYFLLIAIVISSFGIWVFFQIQDLSKFILLLFIIVIITLMMLHIRYLNHPKIKSQFSP